MNCHRSFFFNHLVTPLIYLQTPWGFPNSRLRTAGKKVTTPNAAYWAKLKANFIYVVHFTREIPYVIYKKKGKTEKDEEKDNYLFITNTQEVNYSFKREQSQQTEK